MKVHAVVPASVGADRLVGWVACHDIRDGARAREGRAGEGAWLARKGDCLDRVAAERLVGSGVSEVHLIEMGPGDLHEDPAGDRLARAAAGPGIQVRAASGGQRALVAEWRGLLRVAVDALAEVNALEGVSVYTLYDGQVVDAGDVVARAKATPLVIPESIVRDAERRAGEAAGLVRVRPFRPRGVGAVAPASLDARTRARFEGVLREKLAWLGAPLRALEFATAAAADLARAVERCRAAGAEIVVAAGANALDPLDPVFEAVERLGGRFLRRGVPAHPGSLLWLAVIEDLPVLGMPACGMFSQATLFDLLLPRLLAGERVGPAELAAYGHGGLLGREMAFRFPPYRAGQERGAIPD